MTTHPLYGIQRGYEALQLIPANQPMDALTFALLDAGNTLEQMAQQPSGLTALTLGTFLFAATVACRYWSNLKQPFGRKV